MEPEFWLDRWSQGRIGFHQAHVDRLLQQYWAALDIDEGSRVLVPLCGKSLDLLWLRDRGHEVIGVELSEVATEAFFPENGVPGRRRKLAKFDRYEASQLTLFRGDLFDLTSVLLGDVSAIYDRAALISWAPKLRVAYVEHLTAITRKGTSILLITLEYPQAQRYGPPFSLEFAELDRLYSKNYSVEELARRDVLGGAPKMGDKGISSMSEVCYRLVRKG